MPIRRCPRRRQSRLHRYDLTLLKPPLRAGCVRHLHVRTAPGSWANPPAWGMPLVREDRDVWHLMMPGSV